MDCIQTRAELVEVQKCAFTTCADKFFTLDELSEIRRYEKMYIYKLVVEVLHDDYTKF